MDIETISLNRLNAGADDFDAVVVIDVLRSFTTACHALAAGARAIYLADGPAAAWLLWRRRPHALLIGALGGGKPVPGFDYGNSPSALAAGALADQDVILSTAAGVRGLMRFASRKAVFGAALCNAAATAGAVAAGSPNRVALVVTGEWVDRDGDEDIACADYLKDLLAGQAGCPAAAEERVRRSDFGRRFGSPAYPFLPAADLDCCASADRFAFALRLSGDHEGWTLLGSTPTSP